MSTTKLLMKQVTKTYGDGDTTVSVLNNLNLIVNEGNSLPFLGLREQGRVHSFQQREHFLRLPVVRFS